MPTFDEDLEAIFTSGDFDTCAVFTISATVELCVNGIFTDASDAVVIYGVEIEALKPTLICQTSEITTVRNKMAVVIDETTYQVERIEKIGQGCSVVYLKT